MHTLKIEFAFVKIDGALFFPNDNLPGEFDLTYNQPQDTAAKMLTPGNLVHLSNFKLNLNTTPPYPAYHSGSKIIQSKIDEKWVTLTAHCYNGDDGYRPEGRYARTMYHVFVHLNGDSKVSPAFNDAHGSMTPAGGDYATYCITAE